MLWRVFGLRCATGINFALLGHSIGLWMQSCNISIEYVTTFGAVFTVPYLFSPFLYSFVSKQGVLSPRILKFLFLQWYLSLFAMTFFNPWQAWFAVCAFVAATIGALLEILIIHNIKDAAGSDGAHSVSSRLYIGQLAGMTFTSQASLLMSAYVGWNTVYQALVLLSLACALPSLNMLIVTGNAPQIDVRSAISDLLTNRQTVFWLVTLTLLCKLQSGLLSQTPQLFFRTQGMTIQAIVAAKTFGILGQFLGFITSGLCKTNRGITGLFLIRSAVAGSFAVFAYTGLLAYTDYQVPITGSVLCIEKLTRAIDNIVLGAVYLQCCSRVHGASQYSLLRTFSDLARASSDVASGHLVKHIGWTLLFCCSAVTSIVTAVAYGAYNRANLKPKT